MKVHIQESRSAAITDSQASLLATTCISMVDKTIETKRPLCDIVKSGTSQLRKHLGGHLEELNLFVLPLANADSWTESSSIVSFDDTVEDIEMTFSDGNNETRQNDVTDINPSHQQTESYNPIDPLFPPTDSSRVTADYTRHTSLHRLSAFERLALGKRPGQQDR